MKIKIYTCFLFFFVFLGNCQCLLAQDLSIHVLRKSEGLTSNNTWSSANLYIDENDFVWIGTQGGLNRYDGYDILSFNGSHNSPTDIPNNKITAITPDHFGNIWLGSEEEGLIKYDRIKESFQSYPSASRSADSIEITQINSIRTDEEGNLFISAAFEGLYKYLLKEDTITQVIFTEEKYESRFVNTTYFLKSGKMLIIAFRAVYIGDFEAGFKKIPVPHRYYLRSAIELPDGNIRLYGQRFPKYFLLDPIELTLDTINTPNELWVCDAYIDSNNTIWTSYKEGILSSEKFGTDSIAFHTIQTEINGKTTDICLCNMSDKVNGEIFYSSSETGAGSFHTANSGFSFLEEGLIGPIQLYHDTLFFVDGNKIKFLSGNKIETLYLNSPSLNNIWGFIIDRKGHIWVHYTDELEFQFNEFDRQGNLLSQGKPARLFPQIEQLSDGNLVIGCKKYDDFDRKYQVKFIGEYYEEISGKEYPKFRTKYFKELKNGELWLLTFASGILRISEDRSSFDYIPYDPQGHGKLNSNNPYYLYETKNGEIIVCTDKGINVKYHGDPKFHYVKSEDVNLQEVKGMVEDENGIVWILTREKVGRFNLVTRKLYYYPIPEGFEIEYEEPTDAVIDSNGIIYYTGINGLVKLDPKVLELQAAPAPILFTDLYLRRSRVYPDDETEILDSSILVQNQFQVAYKNRDLGFSFVSPHGKKIGTRYFYRLLGYDSEWKQAGDDRTIHYINLSPGDYQFEVKAQSSGGKWTEKSAIIYFTIDTPYYMRWWAYVFYVLLVFCIAFSIYKYRVNELVKYQNLRTKISSDIHDDVGSLLSGLAMQAEVMSYDSKDEEQKLQLEDISETSRLAIENLRDTVWAIDSRKDKYENLISRMQNHAEQKLGLAGINFNFELNGFSDSRKIDPKNRQNIYLIFKEAINNIINHSNATHVSITFSKSINGLELRIKDNGTIINKDTSTDGLGISNMKLRAKNIGGSLLINTLDGWEIILMVK